jgi:hypothetical protein
MLLAAWLLFIGTTLKPSVQRDNARDRKSQQKFNFFFCNFQLQVSKKTAPCQFMLSLKAQSRNMVESTHIARKYRNVGYYVNFSWTCKISTKRRTTYIQNT